ncbi:MAG TPA: hypothetical protein PKA06_09680, partial [Gemmatales bacterium]|nr:hypothetical protein [Gemmatales bacterium]
TGVKITPAKGPLPKQWGLTRAMCENALLYLVHHLEMKYPTVDKNYKRDYAKIFSLFLDRPLIFNVISTLNNAISANASGTSGETNWLRLSSVLAYYEKMCFFPTDILLPMGILSSSDFYFYIRRGYVLKDYGAGVKHGEFTHRLQWHVIMSVITNDFTLPITDGWEHTPLQLYTSLGKKDNEGIWAYLLDTAGDGGFNHPDSFHAWLLQSNFGTLKAMLTKRETKRRHEFVQDIVDYIDNELIAQQGMLIHYPKRFLTTLNPYHSHEDFKKFEKWFVNKILRKNFTEQATSKIYHDLAGKNEPAYVAKKTAPIASFHTAPKHRSKAYISTGVGAVYTLSDKALMTESQADLMATKSRFALNKKV